MHATTANEPTITTTTSCTTRTEYNQRLISLLKQNEELETKLQQVKRSGQRYQLKSTIQDILIKELMETIEQQQQSTTIVTTKNNNNEKKNTDLLLVLTTNYTQRMAELSMERETMKREKQVQQERRLLNRNCDNDGETTTDATNVVIDTIPVDDDTNESVIMKDILRQRDSYRTKYESLEKSANRTTQTLKKKHTEREIRCSLSLRTMRQQMNTMELERKRWILSQEKQQTVVDARIQSLEMENHCLLTQQQHQHQHQHQQEQQETNNGRVIMDDQREEDDEEEKDIKKKYYYNRIQNCLRNTTAATASRDDRDRERERGRMVLVVQSLPRSSSNKATNNNNNNKSISIPSLPLLVSVSSSSGEDTDTDDDIGSVSDDDHYSKSIASSSSSSLSSSSSISSSDLILQL